MPEFVDIDPLTLFCFPRENFIDPAVHDVVTDLIHIFYEFVELECLVWRAIRRPKKSSGVERNVLVSIDRNDCLYNLEIVEDLVDLIQLLDMQHHFLMLFVAACVLHRRLSG